MSKTQRHRQEPDRRPCDKHITSPLVRLQTAVLLTSANNNARPAWPCSTLFVRRRCQRTLASLTSRKDAPPIHTNPTQLVNAHVAAAGSPVPIAGLLILRPPCANSMRCLRCVHALALVLLVLGMDHGCTVCGVVCPARANTPTRRPGLGDSSGMSHAAFRDLAPALTASSECPSLSQSAAGQTCV